MRTAFTLTEMAVALLVGAIVAAGVTLSLTGPQALGRTEDALSAVAQFDRVARQQALRLGRPLQLVFDLDDGSLRCRTGTEPDAPARTCRLDHRCRLGAVRLAGRTLSAGQTALWCSERGLTHTYAVAVDTPRGRRWLLLAGLSGQVVEMSDEQQVARTLSLLAPGRNDPD